MVVINKEIYLGAAKPGSSGGSAPVIDELNVTPSTSSQTITAPAGTDGYSPVNVAAVDATIDANITAGNIKSGVEILGVTGTYTGGAPQRYIELEVDSGVLKPSSSSANVVDFTGVTSVEQYLFAYAYQNNQNITGSLDLSGITQVGTFAFYEAFRGSGLSGTVKINAMEGYPSGYSADRAFYFAFSETDITNVVIVGGITGSSTTGYTAYNAFYNCQNLATVEFDWSYIIGGYVAQSIFASCPSLTSVDVRKIVGIASTPTLANAAPLRNSLSGNEGVTTLDFASLTSVSRHGLAQTAAGCVNLANVYFRSIKTIAADNVFVSFASNVGNCTFHFPANMQATIETMSGYSTTAPFGALAGTVLFDLPSVLTLTGVDTKTYERNPVYDTGTALAWYDTTLDPSNISTGNGRTTPFYTSGTADPSVSDTIYSDAACTTPVTTISSIA